MSASCSVNDVGRFDFAFVRRSIFISLLFSGLVKVCHEPCGPSSVFSSSGQTEDGASRHKIQKTTSICSAMELDGRLAAGEKPRMLGAFLPFSRHSMFRASGMHGASTIAASIFPEHAPSSAAHRNLPMIPFLAYSTPTCAFDVLVPLASSWRDDSVSLFRPLCLPTSLPQLYRQGKTRQGDEREPRNTGPRHRSRRVYDSSEHQVFFSATRRVNVMISIRLSQFVSSGHCSSALTQTCPWPVLTNCSTVRHLGRGVEAGSGSGGAAHGRRWRFPHSFWEACADVVRRRCRLFFFSSKGNDAVVGKPLDAQTWSLALTS